MFIVLILLILLYYVVTTFLTSSGLTSITSGQEEITIDASKLRSTGGTNSAYSIWFYMDDWSYNFGNEKIIFQRNNSFSLYFDKNVNDVILAVNHSGEHASTQQNNDGDWTSIIASVDNGEITYSDLPNDESYYPQHFECSDDRTAQVSSLVNDKYYAMPDTVPTGCPTSIKQDSSDKPILYLQKIDSDGVGESISVGESNSVGDNLSGSGLDIADSTKTKICKIRNVPLQKWVNMIISFNNRTIDIYMNGKLVKTCILEYPPSIDQEEGIVITPYLKGFDGKTSKFKFWGSPMDPQKAWYTYSDGFTSGLGLSNFFSKYGFKMSILENNVESASISI